MHYSIYIPGKGGADPAHLAAVGLGDLIQDGDDGPQFGDLLGNGPDKGAGLYVVWKGSEPVYRPGELEWRPAKPDKARGLPAGRFWWGISKDAPPTASDLQRTELLKAHPVEIQDQVWLIPNVMLLPHDLVLDDAGEWVRDVNGASRQLYERGMWAFGVLKGQLEEGVPDHDPQLEQYVRDMLTLNYRLFPDLISHLRLLSDQNWFSLACNTCDVKTLVEIEREVLKKKLMAAVPAPTAGT